MKRRHTRAPPLVRARASPTPGGIAGAPDRYRSALASNVELRPSSLSVKIVIRSSIMSGMQMMRSSSGWRPDNLSLLGMLKSTQVPIVRPDSHRSPQIQFR